MTIVLSLFFVAVGIALIANSFMTSDSHGQEFHRFGSTSAQRRRIWPVTIGAAVAIGGLAMLLRSIAERT